MARSTTGYLNQRSKGQPILFPVPEEKQNPYEADVAFLPDEIRQKALLHQDSGEYTWDAVQIML